MAGEPSTSDIRVGHGLERLLPQAARPYARLLRLDRPIGTWLLLLPCWWGLALAGGGDRLGQALWHALLFALGAILMRGAGCIVNDLLDRDLDRQVARTRTRPLASGEISVPQALALLGAVLAAALVVLLQFDRATILIAIASLGLVVVYPLMKRITDWPQAVLGLAFNWGALLGWSAARGGIDPPALALYAAGIAWTLHYDTIYAHQDKDDDARIGVRSSALRLGQRTVPFLLASCGVMLVLLAAAGALAGLAWPYYLGLGAVLAHLLWQIRTVDLARPASCLRVFRANRDLGLLVLAALVAGAVFKP